MVTAARLLPVALLGAVVATVPELNCSQGDCRGGDDSDDLGLLQKGQGKHPAIRVEDLHTQEPQCLHFGRMMNGACYCVPGWRGPRCELPYVMSRPMPVPETARKVRAEEVCGGELIIFPYIDAVLWGSAFNGWEDCDGSMQSPIDLYSQELRNVAITSPLNVTYRPSPDSILLNNGHNVEVVNPQSDFGTLTLGSTVYTAQGFHFHTPSEHLIDGIAAPLEMHIVHQSANGSLAVVGILFRLGPANDCLAKLPLDKVPRAGCERDFGDFDLNCFSRELTGQWWSYDGSLTTPPCTEGVAWNVMRRRATVSAEQLKGFLTRYVNNARPVQKNSAPVRQNKPFA